jgi:predicted unusual protein kinase regulating ubiquinone biosynthesis (AarF/ABC1/UbiB family)
MNIIAKTSSDSVGAEEVTQFQKILDSVTPASISEASRRLSEEFESAVGEASMLMIAFD